MLIQTGFLWCVNNIDDDVNDKKEGQSCSQAWPCHLRKEVLLIAPIRTMIFTIGRWMITSPIVFLIMIETMIAKEKERLQMGK